jgi:hypothetical protein
MHAGDAGGRLGGGTPKLGRKPTEEAVMHNSLSINYY